MRHYGRTPGGRIKLAAALKALAVLLRRHPRAALDMASAGVIQAGRAGVHELTDRLRRFEPHDEPRSRPRQPLSRREMRQFRKRLKAAQAGKERHADKRQPT